MTGSLLAGMRGRSRSGRRALTFGICALVVAIAFETIAIATAMPAAARDVEGLGFYAWAFSAFLIGMLFATVVSGRLSDRAGPAWPLLAGLLIFVAGLLVAGTAVSMAQLIAGRFVQGLGSGTMNVAIFVCVAQLFAPDERPRIFTYISTAWVLPSFVGPPVAAWLTGRLSWHWVFFAVIPLAVLGGVLVMPSVLRMLGRWEPAGDAAQRAAPLWAAAVVAAAAAGFQVAGQRRDGWGLALAALAILAFAVGLPPLMPAGFLRLRRGLAQVTSTRGLLAGAFVGGEAFVPLMLVEQRQTSLFFAGAVLTVGSIGWTIGAWLQSRPWLRLRRDRLITFGCLSVALGLALVGALAWWPRLPVAVTAASWVLCGFGMGLATSSTSLATMTLSEPAEQGRNASSLNLADALGASILVGVAGTIYTVLRPLADPSVTFAAVQVSMAVAGLLAVLTSLRIGALRSELGH